MKHVPSIQSNKRKAMKPAVEYQRDVQAEINLHKVDIDKSVFVNSSAEKDLIKEFKKDIKSMKPHVLQKSRESVITAILASKTPKWGSVNVIY